VRLNTKSTKLSTLWVGELWAFSVFSFCTNLCQRNRKTTYIMQNG